ncbi:MAG: hypothetical protein ACOC9P_01385 [bacterium]
MTTTARQRFWLWGHPAGAHNAVAAFNLPERSSIEPTEAAERLGIPNLIMVAFGGEPRPPFEPYAEPMRRLDRLVWSIVGDRSSQRNDRTPDLEPVLSLAKRHPALIGGIMDDYFDRRLGPAADYARFSVDQTRRFAEALHHGRRPLDLWVVLYDHQLDLPVGDHLAACDVITYWTWEAKNVPELEINFARAQALAPGKRFMQGVYLWDYGGGGQPMPVDALKAQCEIGLRWLQEGRTEGMIFLGSCIADLNLEAIAWLRDWIERVGSIAVPDAPAAAPSS